MVLSPSDLRALFVARLGLLSGFALLLVVSILWVIYIIMLIFSKGDPEPLNAVWGPIQSLVLSLDLLAVGLLAIGFWFFGSRHDTIRFQAQNMAMGFTTWTLVTLMWRARLLWTPSEELNPISKRFSGGEFDIFMPHFEAIRANYVGFFISSLLMFVLMLMLVRLIRNYRVWENFQSVNLNLFRVYGLFHLVGAVLMGIGWYAFSPGTTSSVLGGTLLVVFVVGWITLFLFLPILGIWIFYPAFSIHRSAVETLKFILRRKAEREVESHPGEPMGLTRVS